jgi:hypothetical protein
MGMPCLPEAIPSGSMFANEAVIGNGLMEANARLKQANDRLRDAPNSRR